MSSVANRQNEMMKTLSVVAAIFLPMSLVAGIYGMNFGYMPELAWRWGYFAVLGAMAFIGLSIGAAFWLRAWLKWGRHHTQRLIPLVGNLPREVFQGTLGTLLPVLNGREGVDSQEKKK
jgi:magnesium transporter